jgi:hypothetical protein
VLGPRLRCLQRAKENLQLGFGRADTVCVTTSILLSLALLPSPSAPPPGPPQADLPGVVDPHTGAWAVVHAGQLWVCWEPGPDCWRRVELEQQDPGSLADLDASRWAWGREGVARPAASEVDDLALELDAWDDDVLGPDFVEDAFGPEIELGPERWRLGFDRAANLHIELEDRRWRAEHGQPRARMADDVAPVRLARPRARECGPDGQLPAIVGGRLGWQTAPRCAEPPPGMICVAPAAARLRTPVPIRLRAGLELGAVRGWNAVDVDASTPTVASVRPSAGLELLFVIELGFDPTRTNADDRSRAALLAHDRLRHIPASEPGPLGPLGPIAVAEQQAMAAAICGGQP